MAKAARIFHRTTRSAQSETGLSKVADAAGAGAIHDLADKLAVGFSTKYTDRETQLVYYGYRYYAPKVGRFLGRDPLPEKGGLHLYAFLRNRGHNGWDVLGQKPRAHFAGDESDSDNFFFDPGYSGEIASAQARFDAALEAGIRAESAAAAQALQQQKAAAAAAARAQMDANIQSAMATVTGGKIKSSSSTGASFRDGSGGVVTFGPLSYYDTDSNSMKVVPGWGAPNNAGYCAPGANCSLVAVQNAQKAMGVPKDSETTIAQNMGYPLSQFKEGGDGLPSSPSKVTDALNAALNPSGLAVSKVPQDFPFATLVAKGNPLILGTEVWVDNRPTLHLVTAVPTGPDNSRLAIYNLRGPGAA